MREMSWDPETGERIELEDEWERDNVHAPVPEVFRPIPQDPERPLNEDQKEYGKLQVDICRQTLQGGKL